jgi:putative transposon-encoded protein
MVIYGMKGKGTPLKLQKEVKPFGDAAHVLVPKSWIGWQVQVKVIRPKGR